MTLWTAIRPTPSGVRILTTRDDEICLKARLSAPHHPRALGWFLEALALWEGEPVHAALSVRGRGRTCIEDLLAESPFGIEGPLYRVELVDPVTMKTRLRDRVGGGLGSFQDLRQLRLFAGGER